MVGAPFAGVGRAWGARGAPIPSAVDPGRVAAGRHSAETGRCLAVPKARRSRKPGTECRAPVLAVPLPLVPAQNLTTSVQTPPCPVKVPHECGARPVRCSASASADRLCAKAETTVGLRLLRPLSDTSPCSGVRTRREAGGGSWSGPLPPVTSTAWARTDVQTARRRTAVTGRSPRR
jgi:hypothetical protein